MFQSHIELKIDLEKRKLWNKSKMNQIKTLGQSVDQDFNQKSK